MQIVSGLFEGYTGVVQSISEDMRTVTVLVKRGPPRCSGRDGDFPRQTGTVTLPAPVTDRKHPFAGLACPGTRRSAHRKKLPAFCTEYATEKPARRATVQVAANSEPTWEGENLPMALLPRKYHILEVNHYGKKDSGLYQAPTACR